MTFPPPPTSAIDWSKIGFAITPTNGHAISTYTPTSGWSRPTFSTDPNLPLHVLSPALNYGQQCYEGLKAFRSPTGTINVFRPKANSARLNKSASYISIPDVPESLFLEAINLAVARNAEFVPPAESGATLYIRPLLFGSGAQLALDPTDEYTFLVAVVPTGVYHGVKPVDCLVLESFDRCAPRGVGAAKVGGNYAPVLRHSAAAKKKGYGITLHLDAQTRSKIDEFSTSGFLGVKVDGQGKKTVVVPQSENIIESVTSASLCTIAEEVLGWGVEKREISWSEVEEGGFKEVCAVGTAAGLVPIRSITKGEKVVQYLEGDVPGESAVELLAKLREVQFGKGEDRWGWRFEVTEA
ncbi:branched-chain amino acid aminotransferase [Ascobolus immersus RN42]|uniref:Branched-chain amino acid aminotransferase n=1 Tax=Ascobolus immersus RN42 TaxID=1160509 RepID=A0A3N4IFR7_ASCIM|nr:branched-chain amino acid aminotransferase [Ascobolus immersus RN42]